MNIQQNARNLRKNLTPQEKKLWQILKNRQFFGFRFLRQYSIGNYIVDFVCHSKKIIIELDGGQHNECENISRDEKRTKFLNDQGYNVIRFWNNEIDNNFEGCYQKLMIEFGADS